MTAAERAKAFVDEILIPREVDAELGRLGAEDIALIRLVTYGDVAAVFTVMALAPSPTPIRTASDAPGVVAGPQRRDGPPG